MTRQMINSKRVSTRVKKVRVYDYTDEAGTKKTVSKQKKVEQSIIDDCPCDCVLKQVTCQKHHLKIGYSKGKVFWNIQ